MIRYFDCLYTGHVDIDADTAGYTGTPVNDRSYSDDELASVFEKAEDIAKLLDRLGFDTFWGAEHHFQPEGYECVPNLFLMNLHLAHLTEHIRLGCAFNVTPMWHPLRLAEDYAMTDRLTGGRIVMGVGRGYHTREVETFGSPLLDQAANRDLFEDQVEILLKALNQRTFSHHSKHYDLPPRVPYRGYELEELTLVPRPSQAPVECWQPVQGATERGLDFMVKHGIKGMTGGGVAASGTMEPVVQAWQDAHTRAGIETELGENLAVNFHVHIADTQEQAIEEFKPYFEENIKMFGPLRLLRSLTDEQVEQMADPKLAPKAGLPTLEDSIAGGNTFCGTAEQVIEGMQAFQSRFPGIERVGLGHPIGIPKAMILEQLQRFAEEVAPSFSTKVAAGAAAG